MVEKRGNAGAGATALEQTAERSIGSASITRRRLLKISAGAGLAAALAHSARPAITNAAIRKPASMLKAPNIVVLMTDQERHHMHWPSGWAEKHLSGAPAPQTQRPVLQPRVHGRLPMLAVTRADDDRAFRADKSR